MYTYNICTYTYPHARRLFTQVKSQRTHAINNTTKTGYCQLVAVCLVLVYNGIYATFVR